MSDTRHLAALRSYYQRHRVFPSMAKLCDVVGLGSTASVFEMVGRFVSMGYLERVEGRIAPTSFFFARPLLGMGGVSQSQAVNQGETEVLTLDDYLIDEPNRTALHRVCGDSMRDAGILDGDLVAVEHKAHAGPGDIVAVVVDDEIAVRTLRRGADGAYFLEAANPDFAPIGATLGFEVLGVVVSVARRLRR